MEEARRFLRYVIPGLILMLEVSLYLLLSSYQPFVESIKGLGEGIAFPLSAFLASGGVGFFLAVIYNTLFSIPGMRLLTVNHLPLINDAVNRGWLELRARANGGEFNIENLTQLGAWCIVATFWHERRDSSPRIKGATPRVNLLADIVNAAGTIFMGSVAAIPIWIFAHYKLTGEFVSTYFYSVPLLVSFLHFAYFQIRVRACRNIVDIIMSDVLEEEFSQRGTPAVINVA